MKTYFAIAAALGLLAAAPALAAGPIYTGVHTSVTYAPGGYGVHAIVPTSASVALPGVPNTGGVGGTSNFYSGVHTTLTYSSGGYGQQSIIPSF